jgi:cysteinyl-tRNA synthetase
MIVVHNTASGVKEPLETVEPGHVRMYVCGVTVYNDSHVGHARSFVAFDVIRRWLVHRGYRVSYVFNYTDVDDKIINRANETGEPWDSIARRFIASLDDDMRRLNVTPATVAPKATDLIPDMVAFVKDLVDGGYAYVVDGDVYYNMDRGKQWFGALKHQRIEDMQAGARVEVDERKRNSYDFVLWKSSKPGEPKWDSPWGPGRPGWHIECSTMASKYLGAPIDIHGGGSDLVFPHHESENLQTWAREGRPLARYWVHNGMLNIKAEKMSKSLGNFTTIKEVLTHYDPMVLRFYLLNVHYRTELEFSDEAIDGAKEAYNRLSGFRVALGRVREFAGEDVEGLEEQVEANRLGFGKAMDDDFNTRQAVAHVFELVRIGNQAMAGRMLSKRHHRILSEVFDELVGVLGLKMAGVEGVDAALVAGLVELLLELRDTARAAKDYKTSDAIRARLREVGVVFEDSADGTTWRIER